uniref:Uncharacterized protein n=1 Tax=Chrysotila carterae TaxID=13221 RepID=A0A7S4F3E2_CHRCT
MFFMQCHPFCAVVIINSSLSIQHRPPNSTTHILNRQYPTSLFHDARRCLCTVVACRFAIALSSEPEGLLPFRKLFLRAGMTNDVALTGLLARPTSGVLRLRCVQVVVQGDMFVKLQPK